MLTDATAWSRGVVQRCLTVESARRDDRILRRLQECLIQGVIVGNSVYFCGANPCYAVNFVVGFLVRVFNKAQTYMRIQS